MSAKSKPRVKVLRFSKAVVITMLVSAGLFTITMIATHYLTGSVPDVLITEFFGFFKVEGGALGIIKVAETIIEKWSNKDAKSETETDFS